MPGSNIVLLHRATKGPSREVESDDVSNVNNLDQVPRKKRKRNTEMQRDPKKRRSRKVQVIKPSSKMRINLYSNRKVRKRGETFLFSKKMEYKNHCIYLHSPLRKTTIVTHYRFFNFQPTPHHRTLLFLSTLPLPLNHFNSSKGDRPPTSKVSTHAPQLSAGR